MAIHDTGTGARLAYRGDELFPLCSTFKLLAAAAILSRADAGQEFLDRRIAYGAADLLSYAPVTREHVAEGAMTLAALCEAAVVMSDNTAANLMLQQLGGPDGVTRYARSLGDDRTRLDRTEPTLNEAEPGDPRDTTTPNGMAGDLFALLLGTALAPASRALLEGWMRSSPTGAKRVRAGLPPGWAAGDKTGTGENGTVNTAAILWPPERKPILVAVYATGCRAPRDDIEAGHAAIGRLVSGLS